MREKFNNSSVANKQYLYSRNTARPSWIEPSHHDRASLEAGPLLIVLSFRVGWLSIPAVIRWMLDAINGGRRQGRTTAVHAKPPRPNCWASPSVLFEVTWLLLPSTAPYTEHSFRMRPDQPVDILMNLELYFPCWSCADKYFRLIDSAQTFSPPYPHNKKKKKKKKGKYWLPEISVR